MTERQIHEHSDDVLNDTTKMLNKQYNAAYKEARDFLAIELAKVELSGTAQERFGELSKYDRLDKICEKLADIFVNANKASKKEVNNLAVSVYKINYDWQAEQLGLKGTNKAESKEAYDYRNQYMFGDQMLIAPVTAPMKGDYSTLNVWLPAGTDWYEWHTGTMLKGGQTVTRAFAIDEYPIYIKAGSILPFCDRVKSLADDDLSYVVTVFPGGDGAFELYEDNGCLLYTSPSPRDTR